jgi:hypothetical protein
MLIAPAIVFFPNRMLCGPFSTSTRSTSRNGARELRLRP